MEKLSIKKQSNCNDCNICNSSNTGVAKKLRRRSWGRKRRMLQIEDVFKLSFTEFIDWLLEKKVADENLVVARAGTEFPFFRGEQKYKFICTIEKVKEV
jgi:hypothetical protein